MTERTVEGQLEDLGNLVGSVLQGTYRIERLLGRGGMGLVYEASHQRLARRFAVKFLFPHVAARPEAVARFQREAQVSSSIGNPHILDVVDFNHTDAGTPYIVMELLPGEDLACVLQRQGKLEPRQATSIFQQTAHALGAAHDKGIVHRDLKPGNIFLCPREGEERHFVKVVDFGISKILDAKTALTRSDSIIGTPFYMAPEQAEEMGDSVGPHTDVFALGVIVYEMLAGRPPLTAETIPSMLYKLVHEQPPTLRTLQPQIPEPLDEVIGHAMRKAPEERYRSMAAFWQAFAAALEAAEATSLPAVERVAWTRKPPFTGGASAAETPPPGPVDANAATMLSATSQPAPGRSSTLSAGAGEVLARPSSRRGPLLVVAVLGVVALAAAVGLWAYLGRSEAPAPVAAAPPAPDGPAPRQAPDAAVPAPDAKPAPAPTPTPTPTPDTAAPRRAPRRRTVTGTAALSISVLKEGQRVNTAVFLDGKPVGQSPLHLPRVKVGRHTVEATHGGLKAKKRTRVRRGHNNRVLLELAP
jgi:serine/threonine-protein kinase